MIKDFCRGLKTLDWQWIYEVVLLSSGFILMMCFISLIMLVGAYAFGNGFLIFMICAMGFSIFFVSVADRGR